MKFGKLILSKSQEWATPFYLNYKQLKKVIKSNQRELFFYQLERELEKVNGFYLLKESEFRLWIDELEKKALTAGLRQEIQNDLFYALPHLTDTNAIALINYIDNLQKLQNFIQTNQIGFQKILKKYDKHSKTQTKEIYLSRKVDIQPIFNKNVLVDLFERANRLLLLDFDIDSNDGGYIHSADLLTTYLVSNHLLIEPSHLSEQGQSSGQLSGNGQLSDQEIEKREQAREQLSRVFLDNLLTLQPQTIDLLLPIINPNVTEDSNAYTLLHIATIHNRFDLVEKLLKYCTNKVDFHQRFAIHYSCIKGYDDIALILLGGNNQGVVGGVRGSNEHNQGVEIVEKVDQEGFTPLLYAIMNGHLNCVQVLMKKVNPKVGSPLALACQYGNLDIVRLLIESGARDVPNADGLYPLHVACKCGHPEIARYLLQQHKQNQDLIQQQAPKQDADSEFSVEQNDSNGWTPVFYACSEGNLECVKVLMEAGCCVTMKDEQGWLPLTYALYRGKVDVAEMVREYMSQNPPPVRQMKMNLVTNDILDDIPSLSLPPPIIPLRIYGHHYLDNKVLLQIELGDYQDSSNPRSFDFFGKQYASYNLKITIKPNTEISFFVSLPLKDKLTIFSTTLESLKGKFIEFDVYPSFGTVSIGRAVFSPHQMNQVSEAKECFAAVFDTSLKYMGDLSFRISVIQPFQHPQMSIGGTIETYWKSMTDAKGVVLESSLKNEFVELVCQVTKDGVVVVYDEWFVYGPIPLPVHSLTFDQLSRVLESPRTLSESLQVYLINQNLSIGTGVMIVMKYPTPEQSLHFNLQPPPINTFIDAVLQSVYDHASTRSLIFSSFNSQVCQLMNWKQPNYGVFLRTYCGFRSDNLEPRTSIKNSIKFCKTYDLLGIICDSRAFLSCPELTKTVKSAGLLFAVTGDGCETIECDAVVQNGVFCYKNQL